jgi:hypothetical protein
MAVREPSLYLKMPSCSQSQVHHISQSIACISIGSLDRITK